VGGGGAANRGAPRRAEGAPAPGEKKDVYEKEKKKKTYVKREMHCVGIGLSTRCKVVLCSGCWYALQH
jgi:hypothetical protein